MNSDSQLEIVKDIPADLRPALTADYPDLDEILDKRRKLLKKVEDFEPVESVDDTLRMDDAKRLRLDLVKCRTSMDRIRKDAGEAARKRVNSINDMFRGLISENESAEDFLKESEEFGIRYEAARKAEVRAERSAHLTKHYPFVEQTGMDLGEITITMWEGMLAGAEKMKHERAEAEEQERLRIEADRLERKRLDAENEKLRLETQRLLLESQKANLAVQNLEQQEKDRQHKRWQEEEAKKKADAKAKRAPDKTKLVQFGDKFREFVLANLPECKSEEAKQILAWIQVEGAKFVSLIKQKAENL